MVDDHQMRRRAAVLGQKVRHDGGVDEAVSIIQRLLFPYPLMAAEKRSSQWRNVTGMGILTLGLELGTAGYTV